MEFEKEVYMSRKKKIVKNIQSQPSLFETKEDTLIKKENLNKKERKPREKKPKLSKIEKKANLLANRIGKNQSGLCIIEKAGRFFIAQRIEVKGKKDKFKNIFSYPTLEFTQQVASQLSENLKIPYNSTPIQKQKREKKEREGKFEVDHSLFKEYKGHCLIFLDFGTIWLEQNNKFHCQRNYEKIDGAKIYELYGNGKFSGSYNKCKDLLGLYSDDVKKKILKEVSRYGNFEDSNSVRVAMEMSPVEIVVSDTGVGFMYREVI
jgi:hypothetical protein